VEKVVRVAEMFTQPQHWGAEIGLYALDHNLLELQLICRTGKKVCVTVSMHYCHHMPTKCCGTPLLRPPLNKNPAKLVLGGPWLGIHLQGK